MKRSAWAIACLALAACGGSSGNKGNAAAATNFNYAAGTTGAPPSGTVESASSALSAAASFQASPSAAADVSAGLSAAADAALGSLAGIAAAPTERVLPLFRQMRVDALTIGDMPGSSLPSGCGTLSGGTVTFDPAKCTITQTSSTGETVVAALGGTVVGAPGSLVWNLSISATITDSGSGMSIALQYGDDGDFAVNATTALAHQALGLHMTMTANGAKYSFGVAQYAALDAGLLDSCASHVVSGTFEAKRVWTEVPSEARNQSPDEFRNKGVKLTWTGCGTATAQFAVQ